MPAITADSGEGAVFFSLYFDLFPNKTADLEVISRASLEFIAAIKEVAYLVAPDIEIRVELESGTEGSLSLNSLIKSKTAGKILDPTVRWAILGTILTWLALGAAEKLRDHAFDYVWDHVFHAEADPTCKLSDDEIKKITERVGVIQSQGTARQHVERFYNEVGKDQAVRGIGASSVRGMAPSTIIPRSSFSKLSGHSAEEEKPAPLLAAIEKTEDVTLISPVLDPTSNRSWVVRTSHGEASFFMGDKDFVSRLHDGKLQTPLISNIKLNVSYIIAQKLTSSNKLYTERTIVKVHHIILPKQTSLLPPGGE